MGNFTVIDEEFVCENCGAKVKKLGYSCRNHCPECLHSKHVDKNPGDRDEECHGLLEPIDVEINNIFPTENDFQIDIPYDTCILRQREMFWWGNEDVECILELAKILKFFNLYFYIQLL